MNAQNYFRFILDFICTYYRHGGKDTLPLVSKSAYYAFLAISHEGLSSDNPQPPTFLLRKERGATPAVVKMTDDLVISKTRMYLYRTGAVALRSAKKQAQQAQRTDIAYMSAMSHCMMKYVPADTTAAPPPPDAMPSLSYAVQGESHVAPSAAVVRDDVGTAVPDVAPSAVVRHTLDKPGTVLLHDHDQDRKHDDDEDDDAQPPALLERNNSTVATTENVAPNTPPRQVPGSPQKSPSKRPSKRVDSKAAPSKPPPPSDPILAADDPVAQERVIKKMDKSTGKVEVLEFPTKESELSSWFDEIHQRRLKHESTMKRQTSKKKVDQSCEKFSSGEAKAVPKSYMNKLIPLDSWWCDDLEWIAEEEKRFRLVSSYMDGLKDKGLVPARLNWTWHTQDDDFMTFISSILSANTRDSKLFDVIYAMRKLGIFNLDALATYDLVKLQDLFLYVGYNNWCVDIVASPPSGLFVSVLSTTTLLTTLMLHAFYFDRTYGPAQIIGAAKRIQELGEIPKDAEKLYGFYGFGRKILMIVLMDVHGETQAGIICDTHLHAVFKSLKWADQYVTADNAARQVEAWLNVDYWYDVNPVFAGLRQLWEVADNRMVMQEIAANYEEMTELLPVLVRK